MKDIANSSNTPTSKHLCAWFIKDGSEPVRAYPSDQDSKSGGKFICFATSDISSGSISEDEFKETYSRCFSNGEIITNQQVSPHLQALALIAANDKIAEELDSLKLHQASIFTRPTRWLRNKNKSSELMRSTKDIGEHLDNLKKSVAIK